MVAATCHNFLAGSVGDSRRKFQDVSRCFKCMFNAEPAARSGAKHAGAPQEAFRIVCANGLDCTNNTLCCTVALGGISVWQSLLGSSLPMVLLVPTAMHNPLCVCVSVQPDVRVLLLILSPSAVGGFSSLCLREFVHHTCLAPGRLQSKRIRCVELAQPQSSERGQCDLEGKCRQTPAHFSVNNRQRSLIRVNRLAVVFSRSCVHSRPRPIPNFSMPRYATLELLGCLGIMMNYVSREV